MIILDNIILINFTALELVWHSRNEDSRVLGAVGAGLQSSLWLI